MEGKGAKLFVNLAYLPSIFYWKKRWKGGFYNIENNVKHIKFLRDYVIQDGV